MHTVAWPTEPVDITGLRVGVIGTGSSGTQAIPVIAGQAAQVTVFQRTPNFVIPARKQPLDSATQSGWKARYAEHRARAKQVGTFYEFSDRSALPVTEADSQAEYDRRWAEGGVNFVHSFDDIDTHEPSNRTGDDYVRARIRAIVKDPVTAETLCPQDHPLGAKRICVGSDYYETFNRPNVALVDLRAEPIEAITPAGVRLRSGIVALDMLVFAAGYDVLTGALMRIDIRGRGAQSLAEKWRDGPVTQLGLMTAGFPNLFIVTGLGSPSVLVKMVVGIEQNIERQTFAVNLDGAFHCCRAVLPGMRARGAGVVVNVASWVGPQGVANHAAYCASKFALIGLTQLLAAEMAPHGVRVNAVCPGIIVDAPMRDAAEALNQAQGLPGVAARVQGIRLRRAGVPDDVASLVAFLASAEAAYISGAAMNVTGGLWMN